MYRGEEFVEGMLDTMFNELFVIQLEMPTAAGAHFELPSGASSSTAAAAASNTPAAATQVVRKAAPAGGFSWPEYEGGYVFLVFVY